MGKIRGVHNSPGIYIISTDIRRPNTRKTRQMTGTLITTAPGGGGGEPIKPVLWVFGDKFPVIFS